MPEAVEERKHPPVPLGQQTSPLLTQPIYASSLTPQNVRAEIFIRIAGFPRRNSLSPVDLWMLVPIAMKLSAPTDT